MPGILGKKLEMTRVVKGAKFIPVTLLEIPALKVVAVKTVERDGYSALAIGIVDSKEKITLIEGKKSLNKSAFSEIREFPLETADAGKYTIGQDITLDILEGVAEVQIEGISKGKGFTGAMKKHNFSGGPGGHGSKFHRALGSIGTRKPRRTHKGKKMHGHDGTDTITIKNIPVEIINKDINVIGLRGGIPGGRNSLVKIIF